MNKKYFALHSKICNTNQIDKQLTSAKSLSLQFEQVFNVNKVVVPINKSY